MKAALEAEIAFRISQGSRRLSVKQFAAEFAALGYLLDRSMDCRSMARYLESGRSYPSCSAYPRETDTGLSFSNYQARRYSNFRRLQKLRGEIFAVSNGAILEV